LQRQVGMTFAIGVAAKGVVEPFGGMIHQTGLDGVEVDIAQAGEGMPVILDDGGFEPVAPEVAGGIVLLVEVFGIVGLELAHELGHICILICADEHMKVAGHR